MNRLLQGCCLSVMSLVSLTACHQTPVIYIVHRQALTITQRYSGVITPLNTLNMTAPVEGIITTVAVQLGQQVKAHDLLFTLQSNKFKQDYQRALLAYLKAKSDDDNLRKKFQGTQVLWRHGLIARNDYEGQQIDVANAYALRLQQANELKKYLPTSSIIDKQWDLRDKQQLDQLFNQQQGQVSLYAPRSGMVLAPVKTNTDNSVEAVHLATKGTVVKQGDSLLCLGDLSGYLIHIEVSQMAINRISIGQIALIQGDAFVETLHGQVISVSQQATMTGFAGMPTFTVTIQVKPAPMARDIRLGMSANVALQTTVQSRLMIPFTAVATVQGQTVVMRIRAKKYRKTVITVGHASLDQIQVLSGLHEGDAIVATYPT